jgi:Zn-finger nucleic acid-binding protein
MTGGENPMEDQKDRFGETMRLLERAQEDIYFSAKDRELIEKLKAQLKKIERPAAENQFRCPKCPGRLESYEFMQFTLDHCPSCGGVWLDKGELEGILKKVTRSSVAATVKNFLFGDEHQQEGRK